MVTAFKPSKNLQQAGFIILIILMALWQISLFQYTLKWDAIDITLPWRYFVVDAFLENQIPWWNPFQHHGFAQGLSLETWYPLAYLLGIARGYDLYSLNLEYIIHLTLAAYGFYRLARVLGIPHQGSLWGALVFPLSGFFIGNAQHTGWIVAGAWIPHILATYIQWLGKPNLKSTLALTIFSFCFVSGGYIAYTIIMLYVIGITWVFHLVKKIRHDGNPINFLWLSARLLLCILTTLSILLVALWQLKSQIDRGGGLSGDAIMKGSLYFKHLVSLILPFSTVKGDYNFWQGDQSMMNLYLGIPTLMLLILSVKRLDHSFYRFWWTMALLSLGFALATELPLRQWLNTIPLFDLFRFPSLYRYFTILSLTLIAAKMIGDHRYPNDDISRFRNQVLKLSSGFSVLSLTGLALLIVRDPRVVSNVISLKIVNVSDAMTLQLSIIIALLVVFMLGCRLLKNRMAFFSILLLYTATDLVISSQLNARVSVLSEEPFQVIQECLSKLPKGYPLPPLHDAVGSNSDQNLHSGVLYRNTNTLYKRIGWNGYTPYQYQRYIEFEKTPSFEKALALPSLFAATALTRQPGNDYDDSYPVLNLPSNQFQITKFGPNHITAETNLDYRSAVIYNQNLAKGWTAKVDETFREIIPVDMALMGVVVESGSHIVEFIYNPGNLYNALIISLVSLFLCLLFYFWLNRSSQKHMALCALLVLPFIWWLLFNQRPKNDVPSVHNSVLFNQIDEVDHVNGAYSDRFLDNGDLERFKQIVMNYREDFSFITRSICNPQSQIFVNFLRSEDLITDSSHSGVHDIYLCSIPQQNIYSMLNNFEAPLAGWKDQGVNLRLEQNNTFQSLKDRDYSATFTLDLKSVRWSESKAVKIKMNHRNTEPIESSLIFNLQDEDMNDLVWKSQLLSDHHNSEGTWKTHEWILSVEPQWKPARYLNVYIWNKGKTHLDIDNIEVTLLSQYDGN